jgi:hypothetical protein
MTDQRGLTQVSGDVAPIPAQVFEHKMDRVGRRFYHAQAAIQAFTQSWLVALRRRNQPRGEPPVARFEQRVPECLFAIKVTKLALIILR